MHAPDARPGAPGFVYSSVLYKEYANQPSKRATAAFVTEAHCLIEEHGYHREELTQILGRLRERRSSTNSQPRI